MNITGLLHAMIENKSSDLFLAVGVPPSLRILGEVYPISKEPLYEKQAMTAVLGLMNEKQRSEFSQTSECNFALDVEDIGRFRVSAYMQKGVPGCVIRHIEANIPSIDDLSLPPVLKALSLLKKGLVLVVGPTGSGKTTSMAAMVGCRNNMSTGHIITIEDPIEYLHAHKKCIVTQREVGIDTESFDVGLRNAMRQAPDVIQIGEIRDSTTMAHAMTISETGHLCIATMHANNAYQAIERILHFYPQNVRDQVLLNLSLNLRAILAQRLVHIKDKKGRVVATEILINTPIIADCIHKGKINDLKEYMKRKNNQGMQTFDQSLYKLFMTGQISETEALSYAESTTDLKLMMKFSTPTTADMSPPPIEKPTTEGSFSLQKKDN